MSKEAQGITPLMAAVASGRCNNADWLIKHGYDVNSPNIGTERCVHSVFGKEGQYTKYVLDYVKHERDSDMIRLLTKSGGIKFNGLSMDWSLYEAINNELEIQGKIKTSKSCKSEEDFQREFCSSQ